MPPVKLRATVAGPASATATVVLLHGLFGMGSNLAGVSRALDEQFRVFSLDLRNHGRSPQCAAMDYPAMAEDVAQFIRDHNLARVHLLGHSMGGKVAMQLALTEPTLVDRLIVADIAPVSYPDRHDRVLAALNALVLQGITSRRDADHQLAQHIDDAGVRAFLLKSLYRNERGDFAWRFNLAAINASYPALRGAVEGEPFAGPVLFIKGECSNYIDSSHQTAIAGLFPGAGLKVVQGAGHWLHAEKPATFNRLVLRFFSSAAGNP